MEFLERVFGNLMFCDFWNKVVLSLLCHSLLDELDCRLLLSVCDKLDHV